MNIGQLFVSLGIKGAEKAKDGITGVTEGLKKTASTSWEVKAGLLGAMYALERFTAAGNARGTGLLNLSSVLGVASQDIERYTYAAQQAGVANEAVGASFENVQRSLTQMKFEGTANKWFPIFAQYAGMQIQDIDRFTAHPEQFIQKFQEFYNKAPLPKSLKNEIADQMQFGALLPAFARNAFTPDNLSRAPTHSSGEIKALDENRRQWANLGTTFDMAVDKLNAKFGGKLVSDITKLVPEVLKLVDAFATLANKLQVMKGIGKIFEGWTEIFHGLTTVVDAFSDPKKMDALKKNIANFLGDDKQAVVANAEGALAGAVLGDKEGNKVAEAMNTKLGIHMKDGHLVISLGDRVLWDSTVSAVPPEDLAKFAEPEKNGSASGSAAPALPSAAAAAAPSVPSHAVNPGGSAQVEFNQTLHFNDKGRDALKIGEEAARQVKTAYRQNPALSRAV